MAPVQNAIPAFSSFDLAVTLFGSCSVRARILIFLSLFSFSLSHSLTLFLFFFLLTCFETVFVPVVAWAVLVAVVAARCESRPTYDSLTRLNLPVARPLSLNHIQQSLALVAHPVVPVSL